MSQSILCNYFKVCPKFTLEGERERGEGVIDICMYAFLYPVPKEGRSV